MVIPRSPDGGQWNRKAGIEMARGTSDRINITALGAMVALAAVTALAGCSVARPGAGADHSLDTVERSRAAMGIAADTSYDVAEYKRLTFGQQLDTSYDAVERLRAGGIGG